MKEYYKRLTGVDEVIFYDRCIGNQDSQGYFESPAYTYEISDRNDYAVMLALAMARGAGCPNTMRRMLGQDVV